MPDQNHNAPQIAQQQNCMCVHLKDAIAFNLERAPLYVERTDGRSKIVTNLLVGYEWLGLPIAKVFDWRSRAFHNKGINVFCDDLIDMAETPAYGSMDASVKEKDFLNLDFKRTERDVLKNLKVQNFDLIVRDCHDQIEYIEKNSGTNCMLKHFLESIRRSAALMSMHRKNISDEKLWRSLFLLQKVYITMQAMSFSYTNFVDRKAAPIHKLGCGIVCQDVPHIPLPEGY